MSEVMQEVLDSLAKMGKQWDLGESVGRVWGFLLFKSCPVTQSEIEEGTGYSRGLISRCLTTLKRRNMITVTLDGRENHYSVNTSLSEGFGGLLHRFVSDNIKPMIELLSENSDKINDTKVRETFQALINEYKKLNFAILLFARIIEDINTNAIPVDMENGEAQKIALQWGDKK